jgi:hypothetical protein
MTMASNEPQDSPTASTASTPEVDLVALGIGGDDDTMNGVPMHVSMGNRIRIRETPDSPTTFEIYDLIP